jgi:steroid 5-alpha reductase family enzyme
MWAFRLIVNWFRDFRSLAHEDWRYVEIGIITPNRFVYWLGTSLIGFHVIPTLMVFSAMLPAYKAITLSSDQRHESFGLFRSLFASIAREATYGFGISDFIGMTISFLGIFLQHEADESLRTFRREHPPGGICDKGLWNYVRHPNYLGEILFWLGHVGFLAGAVGIGVLPFGQVNYMDFSLAAGWLIIPALFFGNHVIE